MPIDNLEVVRDESLIWARGTPRQSTFVRMHTHMATGLVHGVQDHAQPRYIPNLCVYVCVPIGIVEINGKVETNEFYSLYMESFMVRYVSFDTFYTNKFRLT